jgi:hypothetical protein
LARATQGARRFTTAEFNLLYDGLGLLRSLRYDLDQFNRAAGASLSGSELRYACYRLTRQAAAFGVRLPRPGTETVEAPGLDDLIAFVEARFADDIAAARGLVTGGVADFAALAEMHTPGTDLLDRGLATGIFGVPTAMRVRACYYSRGKSLFGVTSTFFAALEFVVNVGDRFAVVETVLPIPEFQVWSARGGGGGAWARAELGGTLRAQSRLGGRSWHRPGAPCSLLGTHRGWHTVLAKLPTLLELAGDPLYDRGPRQVHPPPRGRPC